MDKIDKQDITNNVIRRPWTEKYRPKILDEMIGQGAIVNLFKASLKTGELPHMLLYGPPGTGKTSIVYAYARELFGPKNFRSRVIEINASDERGINVVRGKILDFTRTALTAPDPNYPSPSYKLIILDEADTLTTEAQSALRKILEDNSSNTRFCFICNYLNRIISPIISRCNKYRFKPLDGPNVCNKLSTIAKVEGLIVTEEIIQEVATINDGDLRRCIMTLQNLKYLSDKQIYKKTVRDMLGIIDDTLVLRMAQLCFNNNSKILDIIDFTKSILPYNVYKTVDILLNLVINLDIDNKKKSSIIMYFSTIEKRIFSGADEYLQLLSLLIHVRTYFLDKDNGINDNGINDNGVNDNDDDKDNDM